MSGTRAISRTTTESPARRLPGPLYSGLLPLFDNSISRLLHDHPIDESVMTTSTCSSSKDVELCQKYGDNSVATVNRCVALESRALEQNRVLNLPCTVGVSP